MRSSYFPFGLVYGRGSFKFPAGMLNSFGFRKQFNALFRGNRFQKAQKNGAPLQPLCHFHTSRPFLDLYDHEAKR